MTDNETVQALLAYLDTQQVCICTCDGKVEKRGYGATVKVLEGMIAIMAASRLAVNGP
jgi:hypothetical protein